jgi:hypothetical protein
MCFFSGSLLKWSNQGNLLKCCVYYAKNYGNCQYILLKVMSIDKHFGHFLSLPMPRGVEGGEGI